MNEDFIEIGGIFQRGYGFISKMVMQDNEISIQAKGLYSYLCSFSGKGKDSFPSRKKICYDLNVSNDSLSKYLNELLNKKYIIITHFKNNGRFTNNIYTINLTLPCPKISDTKKTDTENFVFDKSDTNNNNNNNNNSYNNNSDNIKKEESEEDLFNYNWLSD